MFKRLILTVVFSIFLIAPVEAATTVTVQGNTVMITAIIYYFEVAVKQLTF